MSAVIAREHAEWLSLIDISGPFLSVEVLTNVLPQVSAAAGFRPSAANLRATYEEWNDEQLRARPNRAIHGVWVDYVLGTALELPDLRDRPRAGDTKQFTVQRPGIRRNDPAGHHHP